MTASPAHWRVFIHLWKVPLNNIFPEFTYFIFTINQNIHLCYFLCLIMYTSQVLLMASFIRRARVHARQAWRETRAMFYLAGTLTTPTFTHIFSMSNRCHQCESKCLSSVIDYPLIVNNQTLIS